MKRHDLPRVELRGHAVDLDNLATVFRSRSPRVSADEGLFWIHSREFERLAGDPDQLCRKAAELLRVLNGVAKTRIPDFHPVELGQCVDWIRADGRLKRRLTATLTVHVRSGQIVSITSSDGVIEKRMALAQGHAVVRDVLESWGSAHRHDWNTLYRILEQIEAAAGSGVAELGWATKAELRRFHHTANSPAILGRAARHGIQKGAPPAKAATLDEAHELIERLIQKLVAHLGC